VSKIICGLSPVELNRAIREIQRYKADLNAKVNTLIEALTEYGVKIAKVQVHQLDAWFTGELESSIEGYFNPSTGVGIIKAGSPYAVYVEFGTGIVGARSPHPDPQEWQYDVNAHGESGWWYYNNNDGKTHWTKGMQGRPFMYNTAKELESQCEKIVKELFNSD
jgi:hypothetical protein